jgi:hypothetical protein
MFLGVTRELMQLSIEPSCIVCPLTKACFEGPGFLPSMIHDLVLVYPKRRWGRQLLGWAWCVIRGV